MVDANIGDIALEPDRAVFKVTGGLIVWSATCPLYCCCCCDLALHVYVPLSVCLPVCLSVCLSVSLLFYLVPPLPAVYLLILTP